MHPATIATMTEPETSMAEVETGEPRFRNCPTSTRFSRTLPVKGARRVVRARFRSASSTAIRASRSAASVTRSARRASSSRESLATFLDASSCRRSRFARA